jgi:hypothetical protein
LGILAVGAARGRGKRDTVLKSVKHFVSRWLLGTEGVVR